MFFSNLSILLLVGGIYIIIDRDNNKIEIYNEEGEYYDNQTTNDDDTQLSFENQSAIINDNVYEVTSDIDKDKLFESKKEEE
ncbi:MAG: hypothetical protein IJG97_03525 [Bacilli bacterium]|nr:hypothetical protein [Bacilli bacterium]